MIWTPSFDKVARFEKKIFFNVREGWMDVSLIVNINVFAVTE